MKPVCVACGIEMYPKKNDVRVVRHASFGPYQVWSGDLWACRMCPNEIITGWGRGPVAEHFEDGFNDALWAATYHVDRPAVPS